MEGGKLSIFEAEKKKGLHVVEDALTSRVFGTLSRLGQETLKNFFGALFDIGPHLLDNLEIEFWKKYDIIKADSRISKHPREPDVVITNRERSFGIFLEAKKDMDLDEDQLKDEFLICSQHFPSPFLLAVTKSSADSGIVYDVVRSIGGSDDQVAHTTWKKINDFLQARHSKLGEELEKVLLSDLRGLLDHLGYRGVRGLKKDKIESVGENMGVLRDFLREIEVFADSLEEELENAGIVFIEGTKRKVYRDGTSHGWDSKEWLPSYIVYGIGKEDWPNKKRFDWEYGSYFYLAFYPERGYYSVGYWGDTDEAEIPEVDIDALSLEDKPRALFHEKGIGWLNEDALETAGELDQPFIEKLKSLRDEETGYDIFFRYPLNSLSETEIEASLLLCKHRLEILNKVVDELDLRKNIEAS